MNKVTESKGQPVLVEHADSFVHIILNRPEVINSLTLDMIRIMAGALEMARADDRARLIIISGAGDRGFCAGGDIKLMARAVTENNLEPAMAFLEEENDLDLAIHRYPKPVVVFARGIIMGGGLGISSGADITIASETTRMAMPETRIGFFPDVGSTGWLFLKTRKGYPEFLGLSGYEMTGAECVRVGLADCLIPASRFADALEIIKHHAAELPVERRAAAACLKEYLNPLEEKNIPTNPDMDQWVEEYFAGKTSVLDILNSLKACSILSDLCEGVFKRLSERSPSAVFVTLKCLRRDEGRDLAEVFRSDLIVARYLMAQHDFREGVRSRLIDKDDRPGWDPDSFDKAALMEYLMPIVPEEPPEIKDDEIRVSRGQLMLRDIVMKNRSYRRFYQDYKISKDELGALVSLARLSASAANMQPLKFFVSADARTNTSIFPHLGWAAYLKDWPGPDEGQRPSAYIVILGDTHIATNFWCDHGIAAQTILLGAVEQGLGGCMIASVNRKGLMAALNIPEHLEILLVIALGKPLEEVRIEPVEPGGDIKYYRDDKGVHHVPKRSLEEIILERF